MEKKALIVTCGFPPVGGMGVHRITKFVKYLSRHGWQIYVITVHPAECGRKDYSLLKDIPKEVSVTQTNILNTAINMKKYSKYERVKFLYDYYAKWYPRAIIRGHKIINHNDVDLIFTSFPWASHLVIGFILSMITRKPLIIDYRDCWQKVPLLSYLLDKVEGIILETSKHIVFNNYHTSELYKQKYQIDTAKYDVIENGYDPEDILCNGSKDQEYFNIVYAGNPYSKTIQRPFLSAIKNLADNGVISENDFKVTFVGYGNNVDKEYIFSNNIQSFFVFVEDVTHIDSIRMQMKGNVLLLFANFDREKKRWWTPGKFFEYLGIQKPILLLASKGSAMSDYMDWTKSGTIVDPCDLRKVEVTIAGLYHDWKKSKAFSIDKYPVLPRQHFNFKNLTNKLERILLKVLE